MNRNPRNRWLTAVTAASGPSGGLDANQCGSSERRPNVRPYRVCGPLRHTIARPGDPGPRSSAKTWV